MDTRRQAHAVYRCEYHIVISTRYRRRILKGGIKAYLQYKLLELRRYYPELEFITYNIQSDHVHLVMSFPPKLAPSKVVQLIKTNTATALREHFTFLQNVYFGRGGIWSVGYFISTVGLDEDTIKHYVNHQQREDAGQVQLDLSPKNPRT